MYKYFPLFILLVLTYSCQKKATDLNKEPITETIEDYVITGARDIELRNFSGRDSFTITFDKIGEANKNINIYCKDIPLNVYSSSEKEWKELPSSITYQFHSVMAKPGTYTARIETSSNTKVSKKTDFKILVSPTPEKDCNELFYSLIPETERNDMVYDKSTDEIYFSRLGVITTGSSMSRITYEYSSGTPRIKVLVNCNEGTIIIPETQIKAYGNPTETNFIVSGTGTIFPNKDSSRYIINYTCKAVSEGYNTEHTLEGLIRL